MAEIAALPVEGLTGDQLAELRAQRLATVQALKPEGEVQRNLVANMHMVVQIMIWSEDALRGVAGIVLAGEGVARRDEARTALRRQAAELERLLARLRVELQSGAAAVGRVFHANAGIAGLTEDEQRALKEFQKELDKEQERLRQQQQKAAEQASSGEGKWPSYKFRGGRQVNPLCFELSNVVSQNLKF